MDHFAEHRKRPLCDHVDEWREALVAKGTTEKHADLVAGRVRRIFEGCRFVYWPDLSASRVQRYIGEQKDRGLSIQSCNFYRQAAKQFCRWMVQDGRAPSSPLTHLQGGNVRTDRRHDRRAFTDEELRVLLETTRNGPVCLGMAASNRAMLYQLAVESGLRVSELRSLMWASFDLDGSPPSVTVRAAYTKNRRDDTLPLRGSTMQALSAWGGR